MIIDYFISNTSSQEISKNGIKSGSDLNIQYICYIGSINILKGIETKYFRFP